MPCREEIDEEGQDIEGEDQSDNPFEYGGDIFLFVKGAYDKNDRQDD